MGIVSVHGGNSRRRVGYRPARSREEVGVALVGCGRSGGPQAVPTTPPAALPPSPVRASSAPVAAVAPSTAGFPTAYAVDCAGRPTAEQVVALLRGSKVLSATAAVTPS